MTIVPEDYNVYKLSKKELGNFFTVAFGVLGTCGYVFYKSLIISLFMCAVSLLGIRAYKSFLAKKRKNELRVEFKDMLYSVSSSVSAGRHLGHAIAESENAITMIYGEESILASEIRHMLRTIKETNCSEEEVLLDFAARTRMPEIYDFADVCITCKKTGGNLSAMIMKAASLITLGIELQKEKEVMLAQKRLESRILALMPVMVTALINLSSSDYLEMMYTTAFGRLMMTVAFAGTAVSFLWSMKLVSEEGGVV